MRRIFTLLIVALSCQAWIAGEASAEPRAGDAPAMWAVSDEDNTIYLFGTFHLLPKGTDWLRPGLEQAMAETGITLLEADTNSPDAAAKIGALIQRYGLNPPGVTLSKTLGPERAAQFEAFLEPYGLPFEGLEAFKPWLAILTVTQAAYASAGLDAASGVEPAILAMAESQDDSLRFLETVETQVIALSRLNTDELLASFDVSLEQLINLEDLILEGVEAWRVGDLATLDAVLLEETREQAPLTYEVIFTERNANWTAQIEAMLADDQDRFLAVGAGHLIGPGSVIEMLSEKGHTPVRVQ